MGMKKGVTLVESVMAALAFTIIASGAVGVYVVQNSLLVRTLHKMEALNFARSAAEIIIEISQNTTYPNYKTAEKPMDIGVHDETSDPDICKLPQSSFRDELGGKMTYTVSQVTIEGVRGRRVDINVEWNEPSKKNEKVKETLSFVPVFGQ